MLAGGVRGCYVGWLGTDVGILRLPCGCCAFCYPVADCR